MRTVKAAAVQMSPVLFSCEGTVDKVVHRIHELGQEGVQFATFPETVVPYYPYFSFIQAPYQSIGGRECCLVEAVRGDRQQAHRDPGPSRHERIPQGGGCSNYCRRS